MVSLRTGKLERVATFRVSHLSPARQKNKIPFKFPVEAEGLIPLPLASFTDTRLHSHNRILPAYIQLVPFIDKKSCTPFPSSRAMPLEEQRMVSFALQKK